MKPNRTLALRRESVVDLGTDELRGLAAGIPPLTEGLSCVRCPSLPLTNCASVPVTDCTVTDPNTLNCPTDIC